MPQQSRMLHYGNYLCTIKRPCSVAYCHNENGPSHFITMILISRTTEAMSSLCIYYITYVPHSI